MQLQGTSPHVPPPFCHDAQAATSTSDCTAGTIYNHNPSPHDHLEQGCNRSLLLLSSGPYAHTSFIRTQENKNEKLMSARPHSNKEHLVKFIFCDNLSCWRSSLKGRTYTQRGMSNEGRTVLIWVMKGGLTEQPWIILGGEWQPRDTILLLVKQWRHITTHFYLGLRMPISIGTNRNCFWNPKLCDLPLKYSCWPARGPESYHLKYASMFCQYMLIILHTLLNISSDILVLRFEDWNPGTYQQVVLLSFHAVCLKGIKKFQLSLALLWKANNQFP